MIRTRRGQVLLRRPARPDAGDEAAVLPQLLGGLSRLERERRVEVGEADGQQEVDDHVLDAWSATGTSPIAVRDVAHAARPRRREVGGELGREEQDADREDDRDHARQVDPQRQERLAALVHAPAADAAGVLDRDPPLAFLDVDDHRDRRRSPGWRTGRCRAGSGCRARIAGPRPGPGDDAGEDDEADAVADALLGDQLAEPHRSIVPATSVIIWTHDSALPRPKPPTSDHALGGEGRQDAEGLEEGHRHGQVAGVLVELLRPYSPSRLSAWRRG